MSVMIETENLGRHFGAIKAVDGVSFKVRKGEVLGFLGPNGAGKSTTMKLITCFLAPSFGTAKVGGYDILASPKDVRRVIGYLPENAPLYGEMSVFGFLDFVAEVRGLDGAARKDAIDRVISLANLEEVLNQRIETLSKGFRRRVGLAQALIHDPEILILDEPTDGLDPNQKHDVRSLINGMAKDKCIILSTHILEEVDEVCNRVVIIAHGKMVADSSPDELRKRSSSAGSVTITVAEQPPGDPIAALQSIPGVGDVRAEQRYGAEKTFVAVPKNGTTILAPVLKGVEGLGWKVTDVRLDAGQLDEVFRELTR